MFKRGMLLLIVAASAVTTLSHAQSGPRSGFGPGFGGPGLGPGMGMGMMGPSGCAPTNGQQCPPGPVLMSLLSQHKQVSRQYQLTNKGIKSLTTSEDPRVAALIKLHVQQMSALLDSCAEGRCSQTPAYFDPLFRAVYNNADKIRLQVTNTDKGVRVVEEGTTEAAKLLVQAHAEVVSKFVKNGLPEHHRAHEVPAAARAGLKLD